MQMKDVIRRKRKELDLTQEQMAEYLGVSAPAVNKWESGATYPDLSLVPALARLLKTDLNTLMCFHEDPTREEIAQYMNEVAEISRKDGGKAAFERVRKLVEEYPSCGELLCQMAAMLQGMAVLGQAKEGLQREWQAYAFRLYERAEKCDNPVSADRARYAMASLCIQEEDYEKAEALLERLPAYSALDKRQLQISMYMKQKKNEEAARLIEQKLNASIMEVYLLLNSLATVAVWEGDRERAWEIAGYSRKVMEIYRWDYSGLALEFTVAMEEKDADRCVEILREMLDSLSRRLEMEKSILFTHIATKEMDPDFGKQIAEALLMAIERDEQYQFLREREDFQEILAGYARED